MGHSSIRIKVRRRKVAHLAAQSRKFTVKNCTIPKANENDIIDIEYKWGTVKGTKGGNWSIPEKGFRQPKPLMTKGWKEWYTKEYHEELGCDVYERHVKRVASEYPNPQNYQKLLWKNLGKAAKMKAYEDEKVKRWERKHPKPCPDDDLFKDEMIPGWEHEREQAVERIRDFVVSMFDKLPLTGRFETSSSGTAQYQEKIVAELKDTNGDGHRVNDLDKNSKLLKKAQEITDKTRAKHANLICTNLKDHKRKKGRMILPEAA